MNKSIKKTVKCIRYDFLLVNSEWLFPVAIFSSTCIEIYFKTHSMVFPGFKLNLFNLYASALLFLLLKMSKSFTCLQALQTSLGLLNLPSMIVLEGYEPVLLSPSWMQHELDNQFFLEPKSISQAWCYAVLPRAMPFQKQQERGYPLLQMSSSTHYLTKLIHDFALHFKFFFCCGNNFFHSE